MFNEEFKKFQKQKINKKILFFLKALSFFARSFFGQAIFFA